MYSSNDEKILVIALVLIIAGVAFYFFFEYSGARKKLKSLFAENLKLKDKNNKLEQLEKVKSDLISVAAHQLRTPLAKIKWVLQSIMDESGDKFSEQQKEIIKRGYESNEAMIKLVKDFLDLSHIEEINGNGHQHYEKTSIESLAESVISSFAFMAQNKKVSLSLKKADKPIPETYFDPGKINIALGNLVDNALHYTPDGGKIEISTENMGDYFKVSVKDSGIGIAKEDLDKLFTRFFRTSTAREAKIDGTGLGLFIAKNIVKLHDGYIWAESEGKDKGSTFCFTIPFRNQNGGAIKEA